jgi:CheY-like chemotaxis protein
MRHDPLVAGTADTSAAPILIVEDNEVNAMILRAMLRKHGYEPVLATNGEEGVEMSARHHPGLVLMDLQMPRLDGFAAASAIRAACRDGSPAIVAVTANAAADVREACRAAGFASVLAKPIVLDELIATVQRHLRAP